MADDGQDGRSADGLVKFQLNSWHETLAMHPGLVDKYPLAASSGDAAGELDANGHGVLDAADVDMLPEGLEYVQVSDPRKPASEAGSVHIGPAPDTPSRNGTTQNQRDAVRDPQAQQHAHDAGHGYASGYSSARQASAGVSARQTPRIHTPVRAGSHSRGYVTPQSMPARVSRPQSAGGYSRRARGPEADLELSWATARRAEEETAQLRRAMARRERELAQREAALRHREARSEAQARQLSELRLRLDRYGEELEDGCAALTAQQDALREERRHVAEMQARARRMCAAAVRDDVVGRFGATGG